MNNLRVAPHVLGAGTFSSAQGFVYVGKWANDVANDTAGRMIFKVGSRGKSVVGWSVEPLRRWAVEWAPPLSTPVQLHASITRGRLTSRGPPTSHAGRLELCWIRCGGYHNGFRRDGVPWSGHL